MSFNPKTPIRLLSAIAIALVAVPTLSAQVLKPGLQPGLARAPDSARKISLDEALRMAQQNSPNAIAAEVIANAKRFSASGYHAKYQVILTDLYGAEFGAEIWDRFTVHYTPTHGSWLNQAEIEIGIFSRQCLGTRRIPDLETLRREARAWNRRMNRDRIKINWKFDRKAARRKFGYKRKPFTRSET